MLTFSETHATLLGGDSYIYLKKGDPISFRTFTIQPWGITNEKGESVLYTVIDSLFTSDSSMAYTIGQMNDSIEKRQTPDGYFLNFTDYVAPKRLPESPEPVLPHSISMLYHFEIFSRYALQYDGIFFGSQNIIYRFQSSIGFRSDVPLFASLNFAFGLGYESTLENIRFSFVANYGLFGGDPQKDRLPRRSSVFFVSPAICYRIEQSYKFFFTGGLDVFLYRAQSDFPAKSIIIYLGVGIDLE
jgi:hypothetical protein